MNNQLKILRAEFTDDMLSETGRHLRDSVVPYLTTHNEILLLCMRIALECDARCVAMERSMHENLARLSQDTK